MELREMKLKDFWIKLNTQLNLIKADYKDFKEDNSILIIRSASIDIFRTFINSIRQINPMVHIYVITHTRDQKEIERICKDKYEIIQYSEDSKYEINKMGKQIEYLKGKNINKSIVLYNNRLGMGFDNVEEILLEINKGQLYAFNCYNELYQINNPLLRKASLNLIYSLSDWFWEYIKEQERTVK